MAQEYYRSTNAYDKTFGGVHYVVQNTEDGYYGFAFQGEVPLAVMIGPTKNVLLCVAQLELLAPPSAFV